MNSAVKRMLAKYPCATPEETIHAMREILQEIALLGLWRSKFFEHAAFYGGTALRIIYGLDRFSEDLDFSLLAPDITFDLGRYLPSLVDEINAFGFNVEGKLQEKTIETAVQSAFLKTQTLQVMLEFAIDPQIRSRVHSNQLLKIKLEIDTDPPSGFGLESKYLLQPIPFAVRVYTLPDLFAGKAHALLCRKWKNRVKGRDWYDFVWYCANYPVLNVSHLEARLRQSGHWDREEKLSLQAAVQLLAEAIDSLDLRQAISDVRPFINNPESIEIWSKDFLRTLLDRICE